MKNKLSNSAKKTQIIGILNITPDSFFDGGLYFNNPRKAVEKAKQMLAEGANIIDIGGESTRPGSEFVTGEEELQRVIPVIQTVKKELGSNVTISIDTNKSEVAQKALEAGASIVNSLGGFTFDKKLIDIVVKFQSKIIIYHIKGQPKTMQQGEIMYNDVIKDITEFFNEQIAFGQSKGIKKEQFILDPGIGFGKTVEQNLLILQNLDKLKNLNLPILIGVSRKSHLGTLLQKELDLKEIPATSERLEASLAETAVAVLNGATFVRTHDVWPTKKFLAVMDKFKEN